MAFKSSVHFEADCWVCCSAISGLLKKLNTEDENVLVENTEAKGLHKNVWKSLMEKAESIDGSAEQDVFSKLVKTVRNFHELGFANEAFCRHTD